MENEMCMETHYFYRLSKFSVPRSFSLSMNLREICELCSRHNLKYKMSILETLNNSVGINTFF